MEKYFEFQNEDVSFLNDVQGEITYYEASFRDKDLKSLEDYDPDGEVPYATMMRELGYDYAGLERDIVTDKDGNQHDEYWHRWFKWVKTGSWNLTSPV